MNSMSRIAAAVAATALLAGCTSRSVPAAHAAATSPAPLPSGAPAAGPACAPVFDATAVVHGVDNPYYPLPVGRVMVYKGVRDGQTQTDRVTVTATTKVVDGATATVVADVADHNGTTLESTTDYFAQDRAGNVWYMGEETRSFAPDGTVDTSGSWTAGVDGAVPGVIMLADPQVPCGYRQEYYPTQAQDTAWVVGRGASVTVPYGTLRDTLRTLEVTVLEPDVVDEKVYARNVGIIREQSLTGPNETADLVSVTG